MEYHDFELSIGAHDGAGFPVLLTQAPVGSGAKGRFDLNLRDEVMGRRLDALELAVLRSGSTRRGVSLGRNLAQDPQAFGTELHDLLFSSEELRSALDRSRDQADREERGLRIRLRIEAPELAVLPWEFLYDGRSGTHLALSRWTPVVRHLTSARQLGALRVAPPLKVLGMVAAATNLGGLNAEEEIARVEKATEPLQQAGLLTIRWMKKSGWADLQEALRRDDYHVFHFVGHGSFDSVTGTGTLMFTRADGQATTMSAADVARLLVEERSLRLVVLNACLGAKGDPGNLHSSTASILVRGGIPAVVAMQYEISNPAAEEFSATLYREVVAGNPIDAAVSAARTAVSLAARDSLEWVTPVLHMSTPDGRLFDMDVPPLRPSTSEYRPPTLPAAEARSPRHPVVRRWPWLAAGVLLAAAAAWKALRPAPVVRDGTAAGGAPQADSATKAGGARRSDSAMAAGVVLKEDSALRLAGRLKADSARADSAKAAAGARARFDATIASARITEPGTAPRLLTEAERAATPDLPRSGFNIASFDVKVAATGQYAGYVFQSGDRTWTWNNRPNAASRTFYELGREQDLLVLVEGNQQAFATLSAGTFRVPLAGRPGVEELRIDSYTTRRTTGVVRRIRFAGLLSGEPSTLADAGTLELGANGAWRLTRRDGTPARSLTGGYNGDPWTIPFTDADGTVWQCNLDKLQILIGARGREPTPTYRIVEVR